MTIPYSGTGLQSGDFDNDGDEELVHASIGKITDFGGMGGYTTIPIASSPYWSPATCDVIDVDGDTDLDVLGGGADVLYWGNGELDHGYNPYNCNGCN